MYFMTYVLTSWHIIHNFDHYAIQFDVLMPFDHIRFDIKMYFLTS